MVCHFVFMDFLCLQMCVSIYVCFLWSSLFFSCLFLFCLLLLLLLLFYDTQGRSDKRYLFIDHKLFSVRMRKPQNSPLLYWERGDFSHPCGNEVQACVSNGAGWGLALCAISWGAAECINKRWGREATMERSRGRKTHIGCTTEFVQTALFRATRAGRGTGLTGPVYCGLSSFCILYLPFPPISTTLTPQIIRSPSTSFWYFTKTSGHHQEGLVQPWVPKNLSLRKSLIPRPWTGTGEVKGKEKDRLLVQEALQPWWCWCGMLCWPCLGLEFVSLCTPLCVFAHIQVGPCAHVCTCTWKPEVDITLYIDF